MSIVSDVIVRGWENFLARPTGPLNLRFLFQPVVASILALRAGIRDVKQGSPAYLWAAVTSSEHRTHLLHSGWKDLCMPISIGVILDSAYQIIVHRWIYPVELLFTVILLVVAPYLLLRGPINRILAFRRRTKRNST